MRVIVELPHEHYLSWCKRWVSEGDTNTCVRLIAEGTVLPNDCGDLVDREKLKDALIQEPISEYADFAMAMNVISNAPTVISSDKESKE